ncbi:hypothetical protein IC582_014173 [Cucumis melo]
MRNELRSSPRDTDDAINHISLCVRMVHVLAKRNKRKLMFQGIEAKLRRVRQVS